MKKYIGKIKKVLVGLAAIWAIIALSKISGLLDKTDYVKEINYVFMGLLVLVSIIYLILGTYGLIRDLKSMSSKEELKFFVMKNVFFAAMILILYIFAQLYRNKGLSFKKEDLFLILIVYGMMINDSYKNL